MQRRNPLFNGFRLWHSSAALAFGIGFEMMLSMPPAAIQSHLVAAAPTVPVNQ